MHITSDTTPLFLGTVHSEKCLAALPKLRPGDVDVIEFRADAFLPQPLQALEQVRATGIPWIFTLRDISEGGKCDLPVNEKIALFEDLSVGASWIDVELATAQSHPALLDSLKKLPALLIFSHHNFEAMPERTQLLHNRQQAFDLGADVFKVAAFAEHTRELHTLFSLLDHSPLPVSAMGMGPMGHASRLALAIAGSVLNYGFLGAANAPGQWFAPDLKRAFLHAQEERNQAPGS